MKINQVEQLVGITKKNIRFYEEQGLLSPGRNRENGYRDYTEEDVKKLEQIKLLRKLGLPLEEIRLMQTGKSTVADSMKRHLVTLEREQQNVSHSIKLCEMMKEKKGFFPTWIPTSFSAGWMKWKRAVHLSGILRTGMCGKRST